MPARKATVIEIQDLAPRVVQVTIGFAGGDFRFQPGQYINLLLDERLTRAYAIASPPERPEAVELCVRLGRGKGSAALQRLEVGRQIRAEGPLGHFVLPQEDRPVALLAGDTGIAPVRSIVLHMLAGKDPRPITVLYEPDDMNILYKRDFDPLARDGAIRHESGAIEVLIERNRKKLSEARLMIAGFDPFLVRVEEALLKGGISFDDAIVESFGSLP
jgi:ferredoxin-NADP reductase